MLKELIVPKSVAFIMDGNGRWARKRGLKRTDGHRVAMNNIRSVISDCKSFGIKYVTLFAFSTENWNRPKEEVDYIFNLFSEAIDRYTPDLIAGGIKLNVIGDRSRLDKELNRKIDDCMAKTSSNTDLTLTLAVNYGGRADIIQATNKAVRQGVEVTEESFKDLLYTHDILDPDLVIRTSGEQRISNFLLYQMAYSELYFTTTFWPAFCRRTLLKAIKAYSKRDRRYGRIK